MTSSQPPPKKFDFLKKNTGDKILGKAKKPAVKPPAPKAPKSGAFQQRKPSPTLFKKFYERGDLPVAVEHHAGGNSIAWKVEVEKLDYVRFLPIFFDGLRERKDTYKFLARKGVQDMLQHPSVQQDPDRILKCVPHLIMPIKEALNTRDPEVICVILQVLQQLVLSGDMIGQALVPYYRQILPVLNLFKTKNKNLGDSIDYGQRKSNNIGDLVQETLELLEETGGPDAFINLKYMVPTYESCKVG